mmetsp:Transcript_28562/g.38976  ORF Transcript_28562/g.38976 Transcript_28562/m.38976 type:complete len:253 (-) Transcript_28562:2915-3673(-)
MEVGNVGRSSNWRGSNRWTGRTVRSAILSWSLCSKQVPSFISITASARSAGSKLDASDDVSAYSRESAITKGRTRPCIKRPKRASNSDIELAVQETICPATRVLHRGGRPSIKSALPHTLALGRATVMTSLECPTRNRMMNRMPLRVSSCSRVVSRCRHRANRGTLRNLNRITDLFNFSLVIASPPPGPCIIGPETCELRSLPWKIPSITTSFLIQVKRRFSWNEVDVMLSTNFFVFRILSPPRWIISKHDL